MTTGLVSLLVLIIVTFLCGFGWGQWYAERSIRKDKSFMEANKLFVSMPAKSEDASKVLGLLKDLMDKVEADRK